jgi:hypothetical protein
MKSVDTIARIRREFFVRGKSIKQIVRELHVSRNTVRRVLRSGETAFSYEREVQPLPKLGRFQAELDRLLTANEKKPGTRPMRAAVFLEPCVAKVRPYSRG